MDSPELIERHIVLLLGVERRALPSMLHLQKEMFLLSNLKESLKEELNFEKHYYGPYSQVLDESIKNPLHLSNAFDFENKKILLTASGQREFLKMIKEYSSEKKFLDLISSIKLLRGLYDKLSGDELLFLIYKTYPKYTEFSKISDRLIKNVNIKNRILGSLLSKGVITEKRYGELKNER